MPWFVYGASSPYLKPPSQTSRCVFRGKESEWKTGTNFVAVLPVVVHFITHRNVMLPSVGHTILTTVIYMFKGSVFSSLFAVPTIMLEVLPSAVRQEKVMKGNNPN